MGISVPPRWNRDRNDPACVRASTVHLNILTINHLGHC